MTKTDLLALADKCEVADASEQRAVLEAAWRKLRGDEFVTSGVNYFYRFQAMLDAEAYVDAALMLVPEGLVWNVMTDFELPGKARLCGSVGQGMHPDRGWTTYASTPALALLLAVLLAARKEVA